MLTLSASCAALSSVACDFSSASDSSSNSSSSLAISSFLAATAAGFQEDDADPIRNVTGNVSFAAGASSESGRYAPLLAGILEMAAVNPRKFSTCLD